MDPKQLPEDFKEFLNLLNKYKVKYLLLGGWAVGIYGHPRATKDIDFLISVDENNLNKLIDALDEFGAPPLDISDFKIKGNVYRLGRSPIQIDIINDASGIIFKDCYQNKNLIKIDGIEISLISKNDLIVNKSSTGRIQDQADVEKLKSTE